MMVIARPSGRKQSFVEKQIFPLRSRTREEGLTAVRLAVEQLDTAGLPLCDVGSLIAKPGLRE
jgi:hypothetical protein